MNTVVSKILICIPTFNERENILEILTRFRTICETDILIIDDNSPDGTGRYVQTLIDNQLISNLYLLRRPAKEGLGPAYKAGFSWGITTGYTHFLECDADGSHQPEEFPRILAKLNSADLILGTRWMPGGKVINWPLHRRLISQLGTKYAQTILRLPYRDLTGGYRLISAEALSKIHYEEISTLGYGFQIEMALRVARAHLRIVEIPITFIERRLGQSKMSQKIVIEAFLQTTRWALFPPRR